MTRKLAMGLAAFLLVPSVALAQGPGRDGPRQHDRQGRRGFAGGPQAQAPWMTAIHRLAQKVDQLEKKVDGIIARARQLHARGAGGRGGMMQRQARRGPMGRRGHAGAGFGARQGPQAGQHLRARIQQHLAQRWQAFEKNLCPECRQKSRTMQKRKQARAKAAPHKQRLKAKKAKPQQRAGRAATAYKRLAAENQRLKEELQKLQQQLRKLSAQMKRVQL